MEKENKPSREFLERSKLIQLDSEFCLLKHKCKMEELEFERETQRRFHENQMSYHRIKRADINREITRKELNSNFN